MGVTMGVLLEAMSPGEQSREKITLDLYVTIGQDGVGGWDILLPKVSECSNRNPLKKRGMLMFSYSRTKGTPLESVVEPPVGISMKNRILAEIAHDVSVVFLTEHPFGGSQITVVGAGFLVSGHLFLPTVLELTGYT